MHCPQCGYRQDSDRIRFCTKCGLDIGDVRDLLANKSGESKIKRAKEQRTAFKQGLLMVVAGLGIAMILGGLREIFPIPKIAIIFSLAVFMIGGVLRMILASFSEESDADEESIDSLINSLETDKLFGEQTSGKILPEANYQPPVNSVGKNYNTNELVSTPSVTEDTTKKLEKEIR